jgi:tRNA(adenine34) deaminase
MTTSPPERKPDERHMRAALREAEKARAKGEVPIGAVIVLDGRVIARGHNLKELKRDATAHAELVALRKAQRKSANWRITGATVYVTLEPCPMCLSALIQSRVARIVYGAADPVMGACGSKVDLTAVHTANPNVVVEGGLRAEACKQVIDDFWRNRRKV